MNYQWNWTSFNDLSPDGVHTYLQTLQIGACWTIALALSAYVIALLLGSMIGVMRTVDSKIARAIAATYVELFRNVPLLVQMFLWYFVLPELLPKPLGAAIKQIQQPWGQFFPALLCLGFYGTARIAETLRSGIRSLRAGQRQAALALGLSGFQVYRFVILPQAFRVVVPPLTSELMATIKYSSVAMTIGLLELTGAARSMQEFSFHTFEAFSAATIVYFAINSVVVYGLMLVERKLAASSSRPRKAPSALPLSEVEQS
ncbi:amino acid ABC transporter permease [Trinickia soli]|uniref:Glutamate ABC transporter permease n=1 Tax=Trinickia soli TaxID=380675 RepID=A0A2N7W9N5_9BURK|nr:amino acid ABC transporter permease [Trinickia soli]PMS26102.1 glutamate ABC transporter permease [Trinickia soli]CAB3680899.1 Glutamate/aspartate import permease protein GltJ [Trinickia soli]